MSETWRKILQFQEEEKKKIAEAQRIIEQENNENQKKILEEQNSIQDREKQLREFWEKDLEIINQGKVIAISILQGIRKNSKEVRQARFSNIDVDEYIEPVGRVFYCDNRSTITLKWGNKLDLTSEEKDILHKYCYKKERGVFQPAIKLPEKIDGEDFNYISAEINSRNALDIISNPDILMHNLASKLINPIRCLKTYVKGQNYWSDPPPYEEPRRNYSNH